MNATRMPLVPTNSSRQYDFLSQLLSSKSGALRPNSHNGESNNIFSPNRLNPAALPTFSGNGHNLQLQVELPDRLDAFCSRRPKSPSTVVVFWGFQRPWVDTPKIWPQTQEFMLCIKWSSLPLFLITGQQTGATLTQTSLPYLFWRCVVFISPFNSLVFVTINYIWEFTRDCSCSHVVSELYWSQSLWPKSWVNRPFYI